MLPYHTTERRENTKQDSGSSKRDSEFLEHKDIYRVPDSPKHSSAISGHEMEMAMSTRHGGGILRN